MFRVASVFVIFDVKMSKIQYQFCSLDTR